MSRVRQHAQSLGRIGAQPLERGQGHPEALCVWRVRSVECRRRDADNRKGHIVHAEYAANDRGVAGKMTFPESVADNRDSLRIPGTILVRQEPPAVQDANAKRIEVVAADEREGRLMIDLLLA